MDEEGWKVEMVTMPVADGKDGWWRRTTTMDNGGHQRQTTNVGENWWQMGADK